ncbi:MAG: cell division protein FtsB [Burkholderiaceae bacterium]
MKPLAIALAGLLLLIQYPLWLGKGGWLRVWELDRQLAAQKGTNKRLAARNASLEGEVRDLRQGLFAVEERARYELGMVRPDEIFVQINETAARHGPRPAAPEPPVRPAQAPAQLQAAALPAAARPERR